MRTPCSSPRVLRGLLLAGLAVVTLASRQADAAVTRVDIQRREAVGDSGYEKLVGIARFEVDPSSPANRAIADIDRAPRNARGRVEFSADFYALAPRPGTPSNGTALVEVVNRGRKLTLAGFDRGGTMDPASGADLGDRYLLRLGFTLVWVGWEFDVDRRDGLMGIDLPAAVGTTDIVRGLFTPNDGNPEQTVTDLAGYTPLDAAAVANQLTVRDGQFAPPSVIPRDRWSLRGNTVTLAGGFEKGRLYELSYTAAALPIAGLGLAAVRDVASWVRYATDAPVHATRTLAFGSSQSGRFLRSFLADGFNTDESGRQVMDAVWMHIAGGARLSLNERGATPTALSMYAATQFPYALVTTTDPVSGKTASLLDHDRQRGQAPKVFVTNTSVEYWGGGRSAAMVHTSPDGRTDLTLPATMRVYYLTGAQHGPAAFPSAVRQGQQPDNPLEYWWTMRALLGAMDRWLREGTVPPSSRYPRLDDGTLVPVGRVGFPSLPGVQSPQLIAPVRQGTATVPFLVPAVDADGNERAGIRTPESSVALATYTGWNYRNAATGGTTQLVSLLGSRIPFSATVEARARTSDPRRSIAERFADRATYLQQASSAATALVADGVLLADDVPEVMRRMDAQWDATVR